MEPLYGINMNLLNNYQAYKTTLSSIGQVLVQKAPTDLSEIATLNFSHYINLIPTEGCGYDPSFYTYNPDYYELVNQQASSLINEKTIINSDMRKFLIDHYYTEELLYSTATSVPIYGYPLPNCYYNINTFIKKLGYTWADYDSSTRDNLVFFYFDKESIMPKTSADVTRQNVIYQN